jgi:hypothetical protein
VNGRKSALPGGFEDLAPFVAEWGELESFEERYRRRQSLPMARLSAFYDAVTPRLPAIFEYLDRFAFDEPLPPAEALLFRVAMGLTEVAQAVEVFGQPAVPHAPLDHCVPVRVTTRVCQAVPVPRAAKPFLGGAR